MKAQVAKANEKALALERLTEEIRLWWRTDELHQFKPTVLDEVDFTLHYFEEVLFDDNCMMMCLLLESQ